MTNFCTDNKEKSTLHFHKSNQHKSEFIDIDGDIIEVDKKLAPLIRELNKLGLKTVGCCENSHGKSYVIIEGLNAKSSHISKDEKYFRLTISWNPLSDIDSLGGIG